MKTNRLTFVMLLLVLPFATGCGSLKHIFFGHGAPCTACAPAAPAYNIVPPTFSGPYGAEPGCGGELYGGQVIGEYGCGGEVAGSYFGGYPMDDTVIGSSIGGMGTFGSGWSNGYNPDNWQPTIVPGSTTVTDGVPASPLQPVPQAQ